MRMCVTTCRYGCSGSGVLSCHYRAFRLGALLRPTQTNSLGRSRMRLLCAMKNQNQVRAESRSERRRAAHHPRWRRPIHLSG
eukprot:2193174-Rhodomonas_salina.1